MRRSVPLVNFVDRVAERDALIAVHTRYLTAVLGALDAHPADSLMRTECNRFLDESLWAVTEIRRGLKYDTRFVSEGIVANVQAFNQMSTSSHPLKSGEHEHVVPLKQLRNRLFDARPVAHEIEGILRLAKSCIVTSAEHKVLSRHDGHACSGWERYALAGVRVWDRTTGEWLPT